MNVNIKFFFAILMFVLLLVIIFKKNVMNVIYIIHLKLNKVFRYSYIDNKNSNTGFWNDKQRQTHITSTVLQKKLLQFYKRKGVKNVIDFGCGDCSYVKFLRKHGIDAYGIDKNNNMIGKKYYLHKDLGDNLYLDCDYAQSFEVGEHIPLKKMDIFIDNICRSAKKGVIISWAVEGQGGDGHINERNNDFVIKQFRKRNFVLDKNATSFFKNCHYGNKFLYFPFSMMVFKIQHNKHQ